MQDAEFNNGPWEWLDDCAKFVLRLFLALACVGAALFALRRVAGVV